MEKQIFFSVTVQKSPMSIPARVMVEQSLDRVVYFVLRGGSSEQRLYLSDEFAYWVNKNGLPQATKTTPSGAANTLPGTRSINPKYIDENGEIRLAELFRDVFGKQVRLTYAQLEIKIKELTGIYSYHLLTETRNKALSQGIIQRHNGIPVLYSLAPSVNIETLENTIPFMGNSYQWINETLKKEN